MSAYEPPARFSSHMCKDSPQSAWLNILDGFYILVLPPFPQGTQCGIQIMLESKKRGGEPRILGSALQRR